MGELRVLLRKCLDFLQGLGLLVVELGAVALDLLRELEQAVREVDAVGGELVLRALELNSPFGFLFGNALSFLSCLLRVRAQLLRLDIGLNPGLLGLLRVLAYGLLMGLRVTNVR